MATEALLHKKNKFMNALIAHFTEFRITGLDISDLSMKYMSFDRAKKNKITMGTYGTLSYPEGIIVNGEIKDEKKMTEIIAGWHEKEKKKLPSPFVVLSLPE